MSTENPRVANFIIAGTEKAGTTSIFMYLGEHPQVCGSSTKETDFFRQEFTGDPVQDRRQYSRYFARCKESVPILMEASPGYLGEAASVVPRLSSLLPDVKLLFVLRDPIERLYSSYNFHLGRLDISKDIKFEDYVSKCFAYDRSEVGADDLGMDEWFLKTLRFGCYADFLEPYFEAFPRDQIRVMFFEQLKYDVNGFMKELSAFLDIDGSFWDQYMFRKANVTFSGKNKLFHKVAMYINSKTEPLLRQRPNLKHALVNFYKKVNQAREGYDSMPITVRNELQAYYHPCNQTLGQLLGDESPMPWQFQALSTD